jgi:hypothetical protein
MLCTEYKQDPSIRDLLLNLQLQPRAVVPLIRQVLQFEYDVALREHEQPAPPNYLHDYHYHRVWRHMAKVVQVDPSFNELIKAPWLQVNGQRLPNIPAMLVRLESDQHVASRLQPRTVSRFVHCDLNLGNILYNLDKKHFWLIDPRGYPLADIYYGLGKLELSYSGNYDLLDEGRYSSSYALRDDTAFIDFHMEPALASVYAELKRLMRPVIRELLTEEGNSKDIDIRVRFNEAMHFCSLFPFHIRYGQNISVAIPMYAIAAQLLAEVLHLLDIDVEKCAQEQTAGLERLSHMGAVPWQFDG